MKGIRKDLSCYQYDTHKIKEKISYLKGYLQALWDVNTTVHHEPRDHFDEAHDILKNLQKMLKES